VEIKENQQNIGVAPFLNLKVGECLEEVFWIGSGFE
jgi:hypothetical protein